MNPADYKNRGMGQTAQFPYIPPNYKTGLLKRLYQTSPADFNQLDEFLDFALPENPIKGGVMKLLLAYFERKGIGKPPEAREDMREQLTNDGRGDSLCLLYDVLNECGLFHMNVKGFLSLADSELREILLRQNVGSKVACCIRREDVPYVQRFAENVRKQKEKERVGTKSATYLELPDGTTAVSLNTKIAKRLQITPSQLNRILKGDGGNLRVMVYLDRKRCNERVVMESDVEIFIAAVQGTPEYGKCQKNNQVNRVASPNVEISRELDGGTSQKIATLREMSSILGRRRI